MQSYLVVLQSFETLRKQSCCYAEVGEPRAHDLGLALWPPPYKLRKVNTKVAQIGSKTIWRYRVYCPLLISILLLTFKAGLLCAWERVPKDVATPWISWRTSGLGIYDFSLLLNQQSSNICPLQPNSWKPLTALSMGTAAGTGCTGCISYWSSTTFDNQYKTLYNPL